VACRAKRPQSNLMRFTSQAGTWVVDLRRRAYGRGAYVCTNPACHQERSLKRFFGGQARGVAASLADVSAALGWIGAAEVTNRQQEDHS